MKINSLFAKYLLAAAIFFCASTLFAGDISFFGVIKEESFFQTNNGTPIANTNGPFRFQCMVDSSAPDLIADASLQLPSGGSRILQADGNDEFSFRESFTSLSALNSTYGIGTYTLTVDSENDFNVAQLTLSSDNYPNIPQITNYTAVQSIDSSNNFTLFWQPFISGTTTSDFIQVQIKDNSDNTVFRSGDFGSPEALHATNVSIVIPANTFFPGEIYHAQLLFAHLTAVDSTSIPGANGVAAFSSRTDFNLQTVGTAPSIGLHVIGIINGNFQFSFDTQSGKNYQVQFADELPNWQNFYFTNATSSETIITDTFSSGNSKRFFRVIAP